MSDISEKVKRVCSRFLGHTFCGLQYGKLAFENTSLFYTQRMNIKQLINSTNLVFIMIHDPHSIALEDSFLDV